MSKSKNNFNDFHDFYLEPASSYRFLEEWMSYSYGLAQEALLEKNKTPEVRRLQPALHWRIESRMGRFEVSQLPESAH